MNKTSVFGALLIASSAFLFSGCATITRGSSEAFVIESDPPGADVELSNGMKGKTPTSFKVKRSDNLYVKIRKDGYEPVETMVTSTTNGGAALAGNLIFGGLIGAAVDAGTGSTKTHKPNPLSVKLAPLSNASTAELKK
ncbi:MAG: PEGA domain-containing protein [Chlorobiaceae bacterium]|nr:PEGA domain-containing protein [Chlorobiaceae bacterium]